MNNQSTDEDSYREDGVATFDASIELVDYGKINPVGKFVEIQLCAAF